MFVEFQLLGYPNTRALRKPHESSQGTKQKPTEENQWELFKHQLGTSKRLIIYQGMTTTRRTNPRKGETCDAVSLENSTDWENEDFSEIEVPRKHYIRKPKRHDKANKRPRTRKIHGMDTDFLQKLSQTPVHKRMLRQLGMGVADAHSKEVRQQTETLRFRSHDHSQNFRFLCYPDSVLEMPQQIRQMRHQPDFDFDVESDDSQIQESICTMIASLQEATELQRRPDEEEYE